MGIYLIGLMFLFLFIGIPIVFALGLAVLIAGAIWGQIPLIMIYQQFFEGVSGFTFLAVPLFMLAGDLMMRSGITDDIITLANVLVGRLRGGLAHVNIVSSMFFAGISGSAVSDTAAIGTIMIPAMEKNGYDRDFSVAVTASSSVIGPIIPPSIGMVLYGSIITVSIGALFAGGMVPGILLGIGLMLVSLIISKKRNYPIYRQNYDRKEMLGVVIRCTPALFMPVIILGGILGGIFTPTESAAIADTYALILGVFFYKTLKIKQICESLKESMVLSASVLLIVAAAKPLGWLVAMAQIPQKITMAIQVLTNDPIVILLLMNVFLLFLGSVMEAVANILIFGPILTPVALAAGIDPVHFGVIFILNLMIGLATPPFGMCLFVGASIGKISVEKTMKAILPFVGVEILVLLLTIYFPKISTWVPRLFGLIK